MRDTGSPVPGSRGMPGRAGEPRTVLRPRDARDARPAAGGSAGSVRPCRGPGQRLGQPPLGSAASPSGERCRAGISRGAVPPAGWEVLLLCSEAGVPLLWRLRKGRRSLRVPFACSRFQALPLARGAEWEGRGGSASPAPFLLSALTRLFFLWRWGNHFRLFYKQRCLSESK